MSADNPRANGERQSDLAVMDGDEFKQKHRLNQLLLAHDKVEEKANEAWELLVLGEINHDAKNIMIQRAIKQFIREAYNLLLEHNDSLDDDETDIYWKGDPKKPLGVLNRNHTDDIVISGLSDFLRTKEIYRERYREQVKRRNMPPKEVTREVEQSIPEDISWRAYLRLRRFLNEEYSLDLQFDDQNMDTDKL